MLLPSLFLLNITQQQKHLIPVSTCTLVESSWNVMARGDEREGKWRGNWRMEWVTSKRHMTAEHRLARSVPTLQADAHTSAASSRLNWRPPADLNRLVRFAERRNLVSARVPSHFKLSLPFIISVVAEFKHVQLTRDHVHSAFTTKPLLEDLSFDFQRQALCDVIIHLSHHLCTLQMIS